MSIFQPEEVSPDDRKNFAKMNKRIRKNKGLTEKELKIADPIDRYESQVKKALERYKNGLADQTQVENMVSHITQRYMRKYASNDDQQAVSAKIQDLIEKNAKTDVY